MTRGNKTMNNNNNNNNNNMIKINNSVMSLSSNPINNINT